MASVSQKYALLKTYAATSLFPSQFSLQDHIFKKLFIAESIARVCMCLSITVITRALDLMKDLSELVKLLTFFFLYL